VNVRHSHAGKSDSEVAAEIDILRQKIAASAVIDAKPILQIATHNQDDMSNSERTEP
jgi:hypothetical protein